jgi:cytochrome d ubiquinol oxidase subunit II
MKADGAVALRAGRAARLLALATATVFALAGWWIATGIDGFVLANGLSHTGPSSPLAKTVTRAAGAWLDNYHIHVWLIAAPALGIAGALVMALMPARRARKVAFLASAASVAGIVATAGISLFPFLLPSSTQPGMSLTVWDSSSSKLTLFIMLVATIVILPVVIAYTAYALRVMRGPVRLADIARRPY